MREWSSDMRLGINVLDLDHKQLVTLLSLLEDALPLMPSDMADMLLDRLQRETHEHFQREEDLLLMYRPPGLEDHLRDHHTFNAILGDLGAAVARADMHSAVEAITECRLLFRERLLPADAALVEYFTATVGTAGRVA